VDSQPEREKLHAEHPRPSPNTPPGTPATTSRWRSARAATVLTPIEQAVAYATFANGGTRYAPEVASRSSIRPPARWSRSPSPGDRARQPAAGNVPAHPAGLEGVISTPPGRPTGDFEGFPALRGTWPARPGRPPTGGRGAQQLVRGLRSPAQSQYVVLAVIDQGGYGAQAAAPLVRNIFNYIVANPIGPVKVPTPASPPTSPPPTNPTGRPRPRPPPRPTVLAARPRRPPRRLPGRRLSVP
jgi:penicillin-binding protein 2